MIQKSISFILHSRLENVLAAAVSVVLLTLLLTTHAVHSFDFGMLDFIFILLPVGILGVKCLLEMLLAPSGGPGNDADPLKFLGGFFQPLLKIVRDWFPFLLLSACYYSLYSNLIMHVNPHSVDPVLSRMDIAILGNPASILLEPWIQPWLTDFLSLVYFSHVVFFPGVALYFYLRREENFFRRLMMGYLTIMVMGVASYLVFPAVGPGSYLADRFTRELNGKALSHGVAYIISVGRVSYDCFPSLHVGIPLLISLYLRDYRRKWFLPVLLYVACMCLATLYLRYHYLVDVLASFVFAPAAYFLNDFLLRRWPGERVQTAPASSTAINFQQKVC